MRGYNVGENEIRRLQCCPLFHCFCLQALLLFQLPVFFNCALRSNVSSRIVKKRKRLRRWLSGLWIRFFSVLREMQQRQDLRKNLQHHRQSARKQQRCWRICCRFMMRWIVSVLQMGALLQRCSGLPMGSGLPTVSGHPNCNSPPWGHSRQWQSCISIWDIINAPSIRSMSCWRIIQMYMATMVMRMSSWPACGTVLDLLFECWVTTMRPKKNTGLRFRC